MKPLFWALTLIAVSPTAPLAQQRQSAVRQVPLSTPFERLLLELNAAMEQRLDEVEDAGQREFDEAPRPFRTQRNRSQ
jgi:hypothetical protein